MPVANPNVFKIHEIACDSVALKVASFPDPLSSMVWYECVIHFFQKNTRNGGSLQDGYARTGPVAAAHDKVHEQGWGEEETGRGT